MKAGNHSALLRLYFAHNYNPTFTKKDCDFYLKRYCYVDKN